MRVCLRGETCNAYYWFKAPMKYSQELVKVVRLQQQRIGINMHTWVVKLPCH